MIAKIIIKRKFLKGNKKQVLALLNKMRSGAMNQPEYISGETLVKLDQRHHLTLICSWQSMKSWNAWKRYP
jgi:heme-degrading monooxygenase HmoA